MCSLLSIRHVVASISHCFVLFFCQEARNQTSRIDSSAVDSGALAEPPEMTKLVVMRSHLPGLSRIILNQIYGSHPLRIKVSKREHEQNMLLLNQAAGLLVETWSWKPTCSHYETSKCVPPKRWETRTNTGWTAVTTSRVRPAHVSLSTELSVGWHPFSCDVDCAQRTINLRSRIN